MKNDKFQNLDTGSQLPDYSFRRLDRPRNPVSLLQSSATLIDLRLRNLRTLRSISKSTSRRDSPAQSPVLKPCWHVVPAGKACIAVHAPDAHCWYLLPTQLNSPSSVQVPLFLLALPLADPVAVAWAEELVDEDLTVVVEDTVLVDNVDFVVLCTDELDEDGIAEVVDRIELAVCVEVIVLSAEELCEAVELTEDTATELVDDDKVIESVEVVKMDELSVVVTAALLEETAVEELVRPVV
ncbi:hypothetical protein N0V93_002951 [Gnomoniopsis smithogilvyi]|uniref:Uncharacterized protein n=1 Tax=Gnomoniopsis smithogilvyi TaxID=1191159 RepID=A0A9W8YXQ3_9PEZI|nr:hypothetical protein N0V93_002951 [Gnomoniopsis smithogilvyi]